MVNSALVPPFASNVKFATKYRWQFTSAFNSTVGANSFNLSLGSVATTTTHLVSFVGAYRIRRILLWGSTPAAGSTTSISLYWDSNLISNFVGYVSKEITDVSVSTSYAPHISAEPPVGSTAAMWQGGGNSVNEIFALNVPAGSFMDIIFDIVLFDQDTNLNQATATTIGATVGTVYYPELGVVTGIRNVGKTTIAIASIP